MLSTVSIRDYLSPELRKMKGSIMAQWINLLQNNRSVLRMVSAFKKLDPSQIPSASGSYVSHSGKPSDEKLVVLLIRLPAVRFTRSRCIDPVFGTTKVTTVRNIDLGPLRHHGCFSSLEVSSHVWNFMSYKLPAYPHHQC